MNVTYDKIADALYVYFSKERIEKTLKINDRINVDTDKSGNIVGVEVLDASSQKAHGLNLEQYVRTGVPMEITTAAPVAA